MRKIISIYLITIMLANFLPISIYAHEEIIKERQIVNLGDFHSAAIKQDGSLWIWGDNSHGQLGNGTNKSEWKPIKTMTDIVEVSLGSSHSAAIKQDGSLWMWGDNSHGQLGNGTFEYTREPVKIMDNVAQVSLGSLHSAALKLDGTLWIWGYGSNGVLGNGMFEETSEPVKIMDNVVQVSLGSFHSAAIKSDGSLYMWGENQSGQLGNGTFENSSEPIKIMDDVAQVNLGSDYSAAIKFDGSLWMWGFNGSGQLGNGTFEYTSEPVKIMDNVVQVSLGSSHSAAIKQDGSLWMWGSGWNGELGNRELNTRINTPQKVMDSIAFVSVGWKHSAAVKQDGSLWMWGENKSGQLGNGTSGVDSYIPIKVTDEIALSNNINTTPKNSVENNETFTFNNIESQINIGDTITLTGYFNNLTNMDNMYERISIVSNDENVVKVINQYGYSHLDTLALEIDISGVGEGNTNVSVYLDGNKLSEINVTVDAVIADVIAEEKILKAKMLEFNEQYRYYRLVFKSPAQMMDREFGSNLSERSAKVYLTTNEVLSALTLKMPDLDNVNGVKYLETILTDILEKNSNNVWDSSYGYWQDLYNSSTYSIIKKITGKVSNTEEIKTSEFFKKYTDEKIIDTVLDFSDWKGKDIKIETDIFDKISLSTDLVNDFFEVTNSVLAFSQVQSEKISALEYIMKNTKDEQLKVACANVIRNLKFAHKNAVLYFAENFSKESIRDLIEYGHGLAVGVVLDYISIDDARVTPYVPGVSEAIKIVESGQFISNSLINAGNVSKDVVTIVKYAELEDELKNCINKAESELNKNKDVASAENCIALAEFYKSMLVQSCDIYSSCVKNVKKGDTLIETIKLILKHDIIDFIKNIRKTNDYDELITQANNIKETIQNADFYANSLGIDIAQIISEIITTEPSEWAREYVNKAISYGIVPQYLQGNYQNNITRAEFCTLLTKMIEKYTNKEIIDLMNEAPYNPKIFEDSYYDYVYYMSYLGIVNGVSETEFNPLGEITREEAATMLMRTAKYLGIDTTASIYSDKEISLWAQEGVNFVTDRSIMTGTDKGFEPKGKYTKEQAITTFVRFYENLQ